MTKPLHNNDSIEEMDKAYKSFKHEFDEFYKRLHSDEYILKRSTLKKNGKSSAQIVDGISTDMETILKYCAAIESHIIKASTEPNKFEPQKLSNSINDMLKQHVQLIISSKKLEQNLPIVLTMKLYLHRAVEFLRKLYTAVAHFFTQASPNKASEEKAQLTSSFNKFKKAEEKHVTLDETVPHSTKPRSDLV